MIGSTLRLTETRGSRSQPASAHAARNRGDLLGLQLVERHAGVLDEQRRAHQVHALLRRPLGGGTGARAPPDPVGQAGRLRLDRQPAGRPPVIRGSASTTVAPATAARNSAVLSRARSASLLPSGGT